jgi:DNA-binding NarL/FixJ family response regulator
LESINIITSVIKQSLNTIKKDRAKSAYKPLFNNAELTNRELEALKLICEENTANQISKLVFLSQRTVEGIRTKLFEKIHARNTAGLVMYAVRHGIIK